MRVGIITPAFNVAAYLGETIRSVLAQTSQDWTLMIVDDGSTDATAAVAAGFPDPRIRLIRQANQGVSAARNRGLAETEADAILFLDGDDWLGVEALAVLTATLGTEPDAVAAVGPYTYVPGARRIWRPPSGDLSRELVVRNLFANGGHVLIRRAAVERAGLFHPGLRYGEDWEYWTRLARVGRFAAARSPAPLLFVRARAGGAYLSMATSPGSFLPCMEVIFSAPELRARLSDGELTRLRRRAEAENHWIIGRELIRHGRRAEGWPYLYRSFRAAPGLKRLTLLAAASLPGTPIGPFRRYPTSGTI